MDKFLIKDSDAQISVKKSGKDYRITVEFQDDSIKNIASISLNYTDLKLFINALTIIANNE
jgi:uncharacterized protein YjdB